jgi:hypothetical protein
VKKAEEWDKTHKQKYTLPKPKKTKLSSKKQKLDLSSLTRQIKNSVITVGKSPNMGELHSLLNGESQ